MIRAGEIYLINGFQIGQCVDSRPWLVIQIHKKTALVCAISAQMDLAEGHEITILTTDADFKATGLKKNSFIPDFTDRDVSLSNFEGAKRLGRAEGDFKRKIEDWFGVKIDP